MPLTEEDVKPILTATEEAAESEALSRAREFVANAERALVSFVDAMPETERAPLTNEETLVLKNAELQEQLRRINTLLAAVVKHVGEVTVPNDVIKLLDGLDEIHSEDLGEETVFWHERVGE